MADEDGRLNDAAADIDALQKTQADGFAGVREAIGELRGELRSGMKSLAEAISGERGSREADRLDVLARLNAAVAPLATREGVESRLRPLESGQSEVFRRLTTLEPVVATHTEQIDSLRGAMRAEDRDRRARRLAASGQRWQWVPWLIAAVGAVGGIIGSVPRLWPWHPH